DEEADQRMMKHRARPALTRIDAEQRSRKKTSAAEVEEHVAGEVHGAEKQAERGGKTAARLGEPDDARVPEREATAALRELAATGPGRCYAPSRRRDRRSSG